MVSHTTWCSTAFSVESTFNGHEVFLYSLLRALKPATYVELGSFTGCSTRTACEALAHNANGTVHALDAWVGDIHMGKFNNTIFQQFESNTQGCNNLQVHKGWFKDTVENFENASIDVLLIDGQHDYKNVKSDFETWYPKLVPGGIILFHDSNVHLPDYGVHTLIKELHEQHSVFEFLHSHGLAVLEKTSAREDAGNSLFQQLKSNPLAQSHFSNIARIGLLENRIENMSGVVKRTFPYGIRKLLGRHRRF